MLTALMLGIVLGLTACSNDDDSATSVSDNPDPCKTVVCLHGTCSDGICECETGWTGKYCNKAAAPDQLKITKIVAYDIPASLPSGGNWDGDGSNPDPYVEIDNNNGTTLFSSGYCTDLAPGASCTYTNGLPITLTPGTAQYTISLWDYDLVGSDDFIGSLTVSLYDENDDSHTIVRTLNLSPAGKVDIYMEYIYQ